MKQRSAPSHSQWASDHGSPACQGSGCVQHPPIILCNTGSYGSCAITTTCATHTQFRHQRAELRRILPASTGDYQSRIFHHRSFFSSLQVSRDHYCREKTKRETSLGRPCVCSPAFSRFTQFELLQLELVFTFYFYASAQTHNLEVHRPGIEPGLPAWQASILPPGFTIVRESNLDHWTTTDLFIKSSKSLAPTLAQIFHRLQKLGWYIAWPNSLLQYSNNATMQYNIAIQHCNISTLQYNNAITTAVHQYDVYNNITKTVQNCTKLLHYNAAIQHCNTTLQHYNIAITTMQ